MNQIKRICVKVKCTEMLTSRINLICALVIFHFKPFDWFDNISSLSNLFNQFDYNYNSFQAISCDILSKWYQFKRSRICHRMPHVLYETIRIVYYAKQQPNNKITEREPRAYSIREMPFVVYWLCLHTQTQSYCHIARRKERRNEMLRVGKKARQNDFINRRRWWCFLFIFVVCFVYVCVLIVSCSFHLLFGI